MAGGVNISYYIDYIDIYLNKYAWNSVMAILIWARMILVMFIYHTIIIVTGLSSVFTNFFLHLFVCLYQSI